MRMRRDFGPSAADQEIEIASLVGLQYVIDIEVAITAGVSGRRTMRFAPFSQARRHLGLIDIQVQTPLRTMASGPPARASGATCNTTVP